MSVRINRLLSEAGLGSRREVEQYVIDGRVELNGEIAELSDIIIEDDVVTLDGEELPVNELLREVIAMEKYLSSMDDDDSTTRRRRSSRNFSNTTKVRSMRSTQDDWNDGDSNSYRHSSGNRGDRHGRNQGGRSHKSSHRQRD